MGVFRHSDGLGWTFRCFKCPAPDNKRSYRVKPRRPGRRRVQQVSESEEVYAELQTAEYENERVWDFINAPRVFDYKRRVVLVQTDAGVGKDYAKLIQAQKTDVFSLDPHNRLSAQQHSRAKDQALASFHIRSRRYGFEKIVDLEIADRIKVF